MFSERFCRQTVCVCNLVISIRIVLYMYVRRSLTLLQDVYIPVGPRDDVT